MVLLCSWSHLSLITFQLSYFQIPLHWKLGLQHKDLGGRQFYHSKWKKKFWHACQHKGPWIVKIILRKQNEGGKIRLPVFKLHYKTTFIKKYGTGTKRDIDQWIRIEVLAIHPCTCDKLLYNEGGKDTQGRKDRLFNKRCWGNCTATVKNNEIKIFPNTIYKYKLNMD